MITDNDCMPFFLQYEGNLINEYINLIDGLVFTGDSDINPKYYGDTLREIDEDMGLMPDEKMDFQREILQKILIGREKRIPVLGICAGMQSINVAMGGSLIQDIKSEVKTEIEHRNGERKLTEIAHNVSIIDRNSFIYKNIGKDSFGVTTNHHQAIKRLAENFKITAKCEEDGIIEAIEYVGDSVCLGFQWHPERYATIEDRILLKSFFDHL